MNITILVRALWKLRKLRKRNNWTRQEILSYREEKLLALRKHVYKTSPFYKNFHKGLYSAHLDALPVLTKSMMMENFDNLVTGENLKLSELQDFIKNNQTEINFQGRYWINTTSGSTGNPGVFVFNNDEWASVVSSFSRMQEMAGEKVRIFHPPKRAVVSSLKITHMSSLVAKTVGEFLMPVLHLDASEKLEEIVNKLNAFKPNNLVGYASILKILSEEQLLGHLKISPTTIFSSSEVMTNEMRSRIEEAFGKVLFNEYASTETGSVAGECQRHEGMHLLDDELIVEVVDKNNKPVPYGEFGDKLLVTVLFNKTQPLIRYELTDSIKLTNKLCSCGRPFYLIGEIQGRTEDFLYFPKDSGIITLHPNKIHEVMETVPLVSWQVLLDGKKLTVFVVGLKADYPTEKILADFQLMLKNEGVDDVEISVEKTMFIPKTVSGKAPLIKNNNLKK